MKIEFLYKNDSYKSVIEEIKGSLNLEDNEIIYTPVVQAGLNIFSFQKNGENEDSAKKLDKVKNAVYESLPREDLFVITDGTSSYFCQRLYPQMAMFERSLRKVLCLASIKSKDEKSIELCKKIEEQEFAGIYQMLFSDVNYVLEAKKIVNSNSPAFSKHDILKQLKNIDEHNMWDKLFNGMYPYISENFLDIKNGRNKIMHSREISFEEYNEVKNNLEKSNSTFRRIEFDLLEKDNFDSYELLKAISDGIKMLGQAMVNIASSTLAKSFFTYLETKAMEKQEFELEDKNEIDLLPPQNEDDNESFSEGEETCPTN
ncbi:MAG: hypothetical protein IJ406_07615 [Oscillospiraceae bacterium]|nr:hypothetical protein [Oscillospiraceae bacterium]